MEIQGAVVREKSAKFEIEPLTLSEPSDDQILVRIVATGLCHTDLICRDQYYPVPLPAVLGHEGAGIVEKVGRSVTKVSPGDHVVLTFYTCGACAPCKSGACTSCSNFFVPNFMGRAVDGSCTIHDQKGREIGASFFGQSSFATHALTYERNTVKVDPSVPLELLGPLGCGFQTGAGSVLNALKPPPGSSIAIFGAGAVGLSAVMGAQIAGCETIICVDVKTNRLDLARELGATHVINAAQEDPVKVIQDLTSGGILFALETSGIASVLSQAIACTCVGGEIGIVGAPPLGTTIPVDVNFLLFNRKLRGIIEGLSNPDEFIPQLIELYKQGRFPIEKLVGFYPFENINEAVHDSETGKTVKSVIRMSSSK